MIAGHSQEAYCLFGLLSYARKYWRKSLCKKNATHLHMEDWFLPLTNLQ